MPCKLCEEKKKELHKIKEELKKKEKDIKNLEQSNIIWKKNYKDLYNKYKYMI